jgi:hypothetical protein
MVAGGDKGMTTGSRDFNKENYWREIIDRQRQSGKNQSQFCKDEGVADDKFSYWKKVLAKRQKEKKPTQIPDNKINIPFVPLTLQDNFDFTSNQNAEQIEICKIVLRISAHTDKSTLTCILQSLGA